MGRGSQSDRLRQPVSSERSWWLWLTVWTVVGLGIRVASVLGRPHRVAGGDAYFYHNAANLLVAGHGYINPFLYYSGHGTVQTASFPPGFVFVLAVVASVGLKSFFAQRIWCCIVGAAAIVLCGLAGREIGGRKVGLIAAFLVAVYPNIWMSDELGLSETLSPVLVALVLLMAYRFWKRPGWWTAVWLGASIGAAALTRDELCSAGGVHRRTAGPDGQDALVAPPGGRTGSRHRRRRRGGGSLGRVQPDPGSRTRSSSVRVSA